MRPALIPLELVVTFVVLLQLSFLVDAAGRPLLPVVVVVVVVVKDAVADSGRYYCLFIKEAVAVNVVVVVVVVFAAVAATDPLLFFCMRGLQSTVASTLSRKPGRCLWQPRRRRWCL